jgi:chorismate mutase
MPQEPQKAGMPVTGDKKLDEPETTEENFLGNWKTREEAEKGLANMQDILNRQGDELGSTRNENKTLNAKLLDALERRQQGAGEAGAGKGEQAVPTEPDYGKEITAVKKELRIVNRKIDNLDPTDPDDKESIAKLKREAEELLDKKDDLIAAKASSIGYQRASEEFHGEMQNMNIQSMHRRFHEQNPDFQTPEMQLRINEHLAKDDIGMSDPLVAFREIQRDDALARVAELQKQNDELNELLKTKKGADQAGSVIQEGRVPSGGGQKPKTKITDADRDKGMREALRNLG